MVTRIGDEVISSNSGLIVAPASSDLGADYGISCPNS